MEPGPSSTNEHLHTSPTVHGALQDNALESEALRANMYRLLAVLTSAPATAEILELLRSIEYDGNLHSSNDKMATAWKTIRLASEHASVESIDDEYHDLFIGIGRGEVVPYGSWYQTGFMMDRPLVYLRKDLAELGIEREDGVHEPEDHVGALCETMSLMAEDGSGIPIEKQRVFFNNHMKSWIERFFIDLQNAKSARFYTAVGQLGEKFFEIERRYLEMLA